VTSVDILRTGADPLYIEFSADGFISPTPAVMQASMSGISLGGGLAGTYSTYYSPSLFTGTVADPLPTSGLLTTETFGSGNLDGSATGVVTGSTPFALTQIIEITSGMASLNDTLQYEHSELGSLAAPDGGASLMLLGGSMAAIALFRSKVGKLK
jgi:hypothetical protein